ncbi:CDP-alcohol phosphatidyltransferase family protein [Sphingomonas gellani]|nr:CDP-alcohol phosphatidyltransferase family protein [Sphingomonas gellani]
MTVPPPDGSRDRRIEDPTNLWVIHPTARALLPRALSARVSANAVSVIGLALGTAAAFCYSDWRSVPSVLLGLLLCTAWLIADGLDGMIARATGTASPLGRFLDGLCDHGVFILIYVMLAASIGTAGAWALAIIAGAAHAVQSMLYEGERARFHRRLKGVATGAVPPVLTRNPLLRGYDRLASLPERGAGQFERLLSNASDPIGLGQDYGRRAAPVMKVMALLTANVRVQAITVACLLGMPKLFWWFEIVPLTIITAICIARHRRVELSFVRPSRFPDRDPLATALSTREHRHS